MPLDYDKICAQLCKLSFFEFVKEFWEEIIPEDPVYNWHIEYLCNELQYLNSFVEQRKPKPYDLIINIPPGTTKTTICTIMYPAWVWTRDPVQRFMTASYSHALSIAHAVKSRDIIQSEKYKRYFPEVDLKKDQNNKTDYTNSKGGQRFTTSTKGMATGMHAHQQVVDDPHNVKSALSEAERVAQVQFVTNTLATRKVNKEITPLILIMQRLHEEDATGVILEKKGKRIKHINLPAEDSEKVQPADLREKYIDGMLDPIRLSKHVLDEALADLGQYGYAGQFEQNPAPPEGGMFKVKHFNIIHSLPDPSHWDSVARYWDKAGTLDSGCFTAGIKILKLKNGKFVVLDSKRGQWEALEREQVIQSTTEADNQDFDGRKVRCKVYIEQEPGSGGKESAEATIRRNAGFVVEADRPSGDKIYRADPWSVQVYSGNVMLLHGDWNKDFIDEHKNFPFGKFKDQVDAGAACFNKLTGKRKQKVIR